jgi:hypothetical protein
MPRTLIPALVLLLAAAPLAAKDNLGVFSDWAAFRDAGTPRCYAIAMPAPSRLRRDYEPYASIGTWPKREVRNQVHVRLSRKMMAGRPITLSIGRQSFALAGGGGDAWAQDKRMDSAIVAAMRSAERMSIRARDERGNSFTDSYNLAGAETAMDAATLGCARLH